MSAYDFDPDACLHVLQGLLKEIPSGLSEEMMRNIVSTISTTNLSKAVDLIIKNVEVDDRASRLDIWWEHYGIREKLKNLKELSSGCTETSKSWRPTTGKDSTNAIIGTLLENRKQQWLQATLDIDKEIDSTTKTINDHLKLISKTKHTLDTESTKIIDRL